MLGGEGGFLLVLALNLEVGGGEGTRYVGSWTSMDTAMSPPDMVKLRQRRASGRWRA